MTTRHTHLTRDIKPMLPGQSTSGCPACDMHHERERLFEVFRAGYEAGSLIKRENERVHLNLDTWAEREQEMRKAFNAWLQEQVDEVDVVWLGRAKPEPPIDQEEFYRREEAKMQGKPYEAPGWETWPWKEGCERCDNFRRDPQPGLLAWTSMALGHLGEHEREAESSRDDDSPTTPDA